jgi:hypothetical protein
MSGFFQQHSQQSKRLFLQPDATAIPRQAAGSKIGFENGKPQTPERVVGSLQRNPMPAIAAAFLAVQTGGQSPGNL